jgi:hypothetical protein
MFARLQLNKSSSIDGDKREKIVKYVFGLEAAKSDDLVWTIELRSMCQGDLKNERKLFSSEEIEAKY